MSSEVRPVDWQAATEAAKQLNAIAPEVLMPIRTAEDLAQVQKFRAELGRCLESEPEEHILWGMLRFVDERIGFAQKRLE